MSDEWNFFMCTMGENLASIMVDTGVSKSIENAPANLATLALAYKAPDERGLPTNEEFDAVIVVENSLEAFVAMSKDAYVGRITKEGERLFFIYSQRDESQWEAFRRQLSEKSGYRTRLSYESDPEHKDYWRYLYPTPDDWQVINDMAVESQLEKAGDDHSIERRIDHWAYFESEDSARPFIAWAQTDRFIFDSDLSGVGDDRKYCVRFHHIGTAYQRAVSSHTIALRRKAAEFGGDYDGWETSVEKPDDQS